MTSKVYVVMDDGHKDLTPALKFGDPSIIFKVSFYPDAVYNKRQRQAIKHALRALSNFDEENDFLLLIGDLALVSICTAALIMLGKTRIKLLKFDRRARDYYVIDVDFTITLGEL